MAGGLTPSEEPSKFLATIWTRIERAKGGDPAARDQVYWQYRKPVVRFLERRLPPAGDAEALADDVMMDVLAPDFLGRADRAKGRFRDLLLAVTRYRLFNYRRWLKAKVRDHRRNLSFDDVGSLDAASEEEVREFDRFYADEVFQEALERFRREAEERGSTEARIVDLFYRSGLSQAEIAKRVEKPVAAVNTQIDRGRKRIGAHLREVLGLVCRDAAEVEREIKHVLAILSRRGRAASGGAKV